MKKVVSLIVVMLVVFSTYAIAGSLETELLKEIDYANYFATFAGIVSVASIITEAIKKLFKVVPTEWVQRIISWLVGILLGLFAWIFNLGMFEGLAWWQSLLWGFGAGLASNGLFDTGLIEWLFGLFTKKK